MANVDNAIGFVPIKHKKGGETRLGLYTIASGYNAALGAGDPVELTGTGTNIQKAAAENVDNIGVFIGVSYVDANGTPMFSEYWTADTVTKGAVEAVAHVVDDPGVVFRMQCDTLAAADIGALADWDAGAPSAVTRRSGCELVASATGTTGKSVRILALSDVPGNAYGAHALADVMFAEHALLTGAAGAGGV